MDSTWTLSPQVSGTPKNAPALTFKGGIRHSLRFLESAKPIIDEIEERVTALEGRPRRLTVMILFAVLMASALTGELQISKAIGQVLAMSKSQRLKLGLRWKVNGQWIDVSYRMMWHLFTLIARAYDGDFGAHWTRRRLQHNHLVSEPDLELVLDPNTNEIVEGRNDEVRECGPECPVGRVIEDLTNDLLAEFRDYCHLPEVTTVAIDSHPQPTYSRQRSYGGVGYMEPCALPATPTPDKVTVKDPDGKSSDAVVKPMTAAKQRAIARARAQWDVNPPEPEEADPRSFPVMGPTAPGGFMRKDASFPRIADDGRLMHSLDWGAGDTYRGGGPGRPPEIVHGRDCHVATPGGRMPSGRSWPQLALAVAPRKGGSSKTDPALTMTRAMRRNDQSPEIISADKGYIKDEDARLARELMRYGQWLSIGLATGQGDGSPGPKNGVLHMRGWYFSSAMPVGLRDLPLHPDFAKSEERAALAARYDECLPYRFRIHSHNGSKMRLRGPAYAKVTKDAAGNVVAVRDFLVICPNSPHYEIMLSDPDALNAPITTCTPGEPCGCSITVTVEDEDFQSFTSPLIYGTTDWYARKGKRIAIEQYNARVQKRFRFDQFSIQVRPDRWDLAYMFVILAYNLLIFYKWILAQGGLHAVRVGVSPFDSTLIQAILERPAPEPKPKRKLGEPDPPDA